jgi:hypothetical protein
LRRVKCPTLCKNNNLITFARWFTFKYKMSKVFRELSSEEKLN